jgi:tetratricopeptide (TPR) repeat protein
MRRLLVFACLGAALSGCHTLIPLGDPPDRPRATALWSQGQAALRDGRTAEAIGYYEQSLVADPDFTRNYLSLAAVYLDAGEDEQACPYLAQYLEAEPDRPVVRLQYAELLRRLHHLTDARQNFEECVIDAQEKSEALSRNLVHCHSQLMEIAAEQEDDYGEHLHRGIGLYWLAFERSRVAETDGKLTVEGLLCKAAAELTAARMEKPDEARPCWYLSQVWRQLAQQQPARRWLRAADQAAPFTYLTPAEKRGLQVACLERDTAARLK